VFTVSLHCSHSTTVSQYDRTTVVQYCPGAIGAQCLVLTMFPYFWFFLSGPLFGFTKANELFVGRMAQLGFAASLIGEVLTGKGALAQLNIETGVPLFELEPLVIFWVIFFFVAAINPGSGKFINDEDL